LYDQIPSRSLSGWRDRVLLDVNAGAFGYMEGGFEKNWGGGVGLDFHLTRDKDARKCSAAGRRKKRILQVDGTS